jgi:hypothetical protein
LNTEAHVQFQQKENNKKHAELGEELDEEADQPAEDLDAVEVLDFHTSTN